MPIANRVTRRAERFQQTADVIRSCFALGVGIRGENHLADFNTFVVLRFQASQKTIEMQIAGPNAANRWAEITQPTADFLPAVGFAA